MKELSIIIVNYNGIQRLKKCFDSLQRQIYQNFEIIMVDNASTDESVTFTQEYYPEIHIVRSSKNLGFAGGNNLGIQQAKGKYLLLLNNDTRMQESFLEQLMQLHHHSANTVSCPLEADYSGTEKENHYHSLDILGYPGNSNNIKKQFFLPGYCLLCSKIDYEKTGGLDSIFFMYCEEVDWFWRLNKGGYKFGLLPIFINHQGSGSTSGQGVLSLDYKKFLRRNESQLLMLYKNYDTILMRYTILGVVLLIFMLESLLCLVLGKPKLFVSYYLGIRHFLKKVRYIKPVSLSGKYIILPDTISIGSYRIQDYRYFIMKKLGYK